MEALLNVVVITIHISYTRVANKMFSPSQKFVKNFASSISTKIITGPRKQKSTYFVI